MCSSDLPLLDQERGGVAFQDVAEIADIFADALVAAIAVQHEIAGAGDEVALDLDDPHVADDARQARLRGFRVAIGVHDADDALANALAVIGHGEQRVAVARLEIIVRRNVIAGVVRQQLFPFGQPPVVDELGLDRKSTRLNSSH